MKLKEIASQYSVDKDAFENFLRKNKLDFKEGFSSISVDDSLVPEYVSLYEADIEQKKAEADAEPC